jgi:hypothetical protein
LLIEKDDHAIFCVIPWEDSYEKEEVLNYLSNPGDNFRTTSEGIGQWEQ